MTLSAPVSALVTSALLGGIVALLSCWALVLTQGWHGRFTHDIALGIQKFHVSPTPRIGGVGIMLGILAVWWAVHPKWEDILRPMILASLPAFLFGTAEDLSKRVGARARLLATMASGLLASLLTDTALAHTSLPWLNAALQWWPLALAFTAFAVGGVANAVNIVDGFNGLASGIVIVCLLALGGIALQAGDVDLACVILAVAGVVTGFFLVNFPLGKIFLGDGGAYVVGFWLAWLAVLLIERNPHTVSPAAVLLACAYPVIEVVFSIMRRRMRAHPAMHPDRLHMHSLIKCRLARKKLGHWPKVMQNASVSPLVWAFSALGAVAGVLAWNQNDAAWLGLAIYAMLYAAVYRRLVRFRWG